jgi:hypothetical protein
MATTPIEASGKVALWGGWSIDIPRSMQRRNEDGSWSAWGNDWSVDIQIVESTPPSSRAADQPLAIGTNGAALSGQGWTGRVKEFVEDDNGRQVFRYAATMVAPGTAMLCWISYLDKRQVDLVCSIAASAVHVEEPRRQ